MKKSKASQPVKVDAKVLNAELQREARALDLPSSTTDWMIKCVTDKILQWLDGRPAVTETDLNRKLAKELEKYNADLAYVYQNRGKII